MQIMKQPQKFLDEKNAIILNVKDSTQFDMYKEIYGKNFQKQINNQPKLRVNRDLTQSELVAKSMGGRPQTITEEEESDGDYGEEDKDEEDEEEEEEKGGGITMKTGE